MALSPTQLDVTKMYLAAFLRAPELAGASYWDGVLQSGQTLQQMGQTIFALDVVRAIYPQAMSNEAFVAAIYQNVFAKAADAGGLGYWAQRMNAGETRGEIVMSMINAGLGVADGVDGKLHIQTRLDVACYHVEAQLAVRREASVGALKDSMGVVTSDVEIAALANGALDQHLGRSTVLGSRGATNVDVRALGVEGAADFDAGQGSFNFMLDGALLGATDIRGLEIRNFGADDSVSAVNLVAVSAISSERGSSNVVLMGVRQSGTDTAYLGVELTGVNPGGATITTVGQFNALAVGDLGVAY